MSSQDDKGREMMLCSVHTSTLHSVEPAESGEQIGSSQIDLVWGEAWGGVGGW